MKRGFDLLFSAVALLLLVPVLAAAAAAIALESGWPVLFSQTRIGRHGAPFRLWKFRTMRAGEPGLPITVLGDSRIARVGRFLRQTKLDELPQLVNVLRGEMSLIGPRPEIPMFVDTSGETWRAVLSFSPGLVDPAYLQMPDEGTWLASYPDAIAAYRDIILPRKLVLARQYFEHRTILGDFRLLWQAARMIISAGRLHLNGGQSGTN